MSVKKENKEQEKADPGSAAAHGLADLLLISGDNSRDKVRTWRLKNMTAMPNLFGELLPKIEEWAQTASIGDMLHLPNIGNKGRQLLLRVNAESFVRDVTPDTRVYKVEKA